MNEENQQMSDVHSLNTDYPSSDSPPPFFFKESCTWYYYKCCDVRSVTDETDAKSNSVFYQMSSQDADY